MPHLKIKYTIIKGNIFYLNFRVPFYKTIRISLQTDSKRQAQLVIDNITPLILKIKQVGLTMNTIEHFYPLIPPQTTINTLVYILTMKIKEHANHVLFPTSTNSFRFKKEFNFSLDDLDINAEVEGVSEEYLEAFIDTCRNQDVEASLEYLRSDKMGVLDTLWNKDDPFYGNATRAVGFLNNVSQEIAKLLDTYSYESVKNKLEQLQKYSDELNGVEPIKDVQVIEPKTPSTPLFSKVIQDYINANTNNGKKWSKATLDKNNRELSILLEAIGDIPVGDIDSHILDDTFAGVIKGLPMGNKKPYNKMDIKQLIEVARNNEIQDPDDVVAPKTSLEYKKTIQGFFVYCREERIIKTSPTDGMMCKFHKRNERGMFTNLETKAMYEFCIKEKDSYKKWCVPLMIYTGCRNNEVAQLTTKDIKKCTDTGILYLHINELDGKRVKSKAGIRQVPIHSKLIEAGFLDYVQSCDGELFPSITSKTLTRFYQVLKNNLSLPITDELGNRLALYSTRHRFITTLLNATGKLELVQSIVGHKIKKTVTGFYFKGFDLFAKHEAVEFFKF
jgi:integrase